MTLAQANPHVGKNIVAFINTILTLDKIPLIHISFINALIDDIATNCAILNNKSTMDLISP